MPALMRSIAIKGPRFYTDNGALMFVNHIDASTRDGPREATDADMLAFPDAFEASGEERTEAPGAPMITVKDPPGGKPDIEAPVARGRRAPLTVVDD